MRNNELLEVDRHRPDVPEEVQRNASAIAQNYQRIVELTSAVDQGIKQVERVEKRVQRTITAARTMVAKAGLSHPGLDAEEGFGEHETPDVAVPEEAVMPGQEDPVRVPTGIPGFDPTWVPDELNE